MTSVTYAAALVALRFWGESSAARCNHNLPRGKLDAVAGTGSGAVDLMHTGLARLAPGRVGRGVR